MNIDMVGSLLIHACRHILENSATVVFQQLYFASILEFTNYFFFYNFLRVSRIIV